MRLPLRGTILVCLLSGTGLTARAEPDSSDHLDARLSKSVELDLVLETVLTRNPTLGEARARTRGARERVGASGQLPDLEVRYEQWNVPMTRPWALEQSNMLMLGVSQAFPAPGSLPAQRRAAESASRIADSDLRTRELDLALQVRRAFAAFVLADSEHRIRVEHLALTRQLVELAREQYASSRISQEDVLRTSIEMSRVEAELFTTEQDRRSAVALLNTLMGRPIDAPLGAPASRPTPANPLADPGLRDALEARRPEISAAASAAERSLAALESARAEGQWPMFMVGIDAVYDPMRAASRDGMSADPGAAGPFGYSAMLGMTLPWLNPGRSAATRAAQADVEAQQLALESVRLTTRFELADATARAEASRRSFETIDTRVLPQVRSAFEAARASFVSGGGSSLGMIDALRSLLQTRIEHARGLARLETAIAELERAAGLPVRTSASEPPPSSRS